MRQVRDVLRLKTAGVAINEIARRVGVASSTVRLTLKRLAAAGLGWPLPPEMTDTALEEQLFTAVGKKQGHRRLAEPDWAAVHRELKRKHVTLQILWDEYIERDPEGYRYSRFCELYRAWAARLSVTMRQSHAGGDKLFVDYAGDTVPVIIDRLSGKTRPAQIFVAVLGASNFTYEDMTRSLARSRRAEATALPDWVDPQLTKLVDQPLDGPEWLHEIKLDGYRMHARLDRGAVRLLTRTGLDWTHKYPTIAAAVSTLGARQVYLDGELCGVRPDGVTSFSMIQAASDSGNAAALVFYLFDLLYLDGRRAQYFAPRCILFCANLLADECVCTAPVEHTADGDEARFASDSPLEESGFELWVPPACDAPGSHKVRC
jgi:hypothetical protein